MKRATDLFHRIPTHENLVLAFCKAAKGKQAREEVVRFRNDLSANIELLRRQLLSLDLDIGHYRFFTIRDPKVRTVCAASFPERVLHHAIMNVCEPVLDRFAIHDSFACRRGKGNRRALVRAQPGRVRIAYLHGCRICLVHEPWRQSFGLRYDAP